MFTQEQCFRRNRPFVAIVAIHVVQNRPSGELEQDKQSKLPFTKIMYAFYLSCLSATFALQHGGFVPREMASCKGPVSATERDCAVPIS